MAQAQIPMKVPYEIVGGKMRIKMFVNREPYHFIFDTGGKTTITKELQQKFDMPVLDSITAIDVTSQKHTYSRHNVSSLQFENREMNISDVPTLVLNEESKVFSIFGAVGIIGNDVISHFVMEIDSREKIINLLPSTHTTSISLRNMIKFESEDNTSNMPIFKIGLDAGETLKVLFDTGAGPFLSVNTSEYNRLKDSETISDVTEGVSRSVMGIAGTMQTSQDIRLTFPLVNVATKKFINTKVSVTNVPISLLGTALLNYGKVTIDYPRSRFYFEPFTKEAVTFNSKSWNIGLTVNSGELQISSLWGDKRNEASIGDRVIKIDGETVPELDFSKTLINGLDMLKGKDKAELTIESNGTTKVVSMEKE